MAKRHLDEVDNYNYLSSNSNLPEVVVTAKAPYTFANDATRVNNNPLVSVINNNSANSKIAVNTLLKQARDNQLRLDREREYKNRLKRKAELEKKVAQQNRGRIITPSPVQAMMDADNLQTPEAIELAKMNREDEAAESNYINSLTGFKKGLAYLGKIIGVTGLDMLNPGTRIGLGIKANPIPKVIEMAKKYNIADLPGYHISSLQRGNVLEKQLSKQGTISVNSVKALANNNNTSEVDRYILSKVLENHAGEKVIDYNTLRQEAQGMIPKYSRVPQTDYQYYGMDMLGFTRNRHIWDITQDPNIIEVDGLPAHANTGIPLTQEERRAWLNQDLPITNTFTFETPGIAGNTKHYNGNPLGHSRTYTTRDEPDVLHVMESQSDWAQNKGIKAGTNLENIQDEIKKVKAQIKELESNGAGFDAEATFYDFPEYYDLLEKLNDLESNLSTPVKSRMTSNYLQRQLQENMLYGAERGQTKMRYPTAETAAKVEGYKKQIDFNSPVVEKLNAERLKEEEALKEELFPKGYVTRDEYGEYLAESGPADREFEHRVNLSREFDSKHPEVAIQYKTALESIGTKYYGLYPKNYSPQHQTILKKYSDFPKLFGKTFKGQEVRTVTDNLGNSWYEVDIPKDMLTRELKFKFGGTLGNIRTTNLYNNNNDNYRFGGRRSLKSGGGIYIKPENRGKFNATKERTGKTTEELTHSKNPLTRKRAIFAQNAAKWKH